MELPSLHVVYTSGNDIEIVVLALPELRTDKQRFFHDTLLVGVGDVLVTVTAEQ